jgi:hypothetical protein
MIKIDSDIFVFKNIIDDTLIERLLNVPNEKGRVELYSTNMKAFYDINFLWKLKIEKQILEDYLRINGIEHTIDSDYIKNMVTAKWKAMYLLHYNKANSINSEKNVHFDLCGFTFVGCLNDNYDGGDLCFPRQNINYHLERGDIIVYPGGLTHPHYVSPITNGIRNVIVGQTLNFDQRNKIDY